MTTLPKNPKTPETAPAQEAALPAERPAYEAPRILKKRSVARVTLFSGSGAVGGGLVGQG
jgi:hypothetical protein